jgi:hypothetical protein
MQVWIDLSQLDSSLEPEELEGYALRVASELREDIADEAELVRSADVPDGAMSGAGEFILGLLKTEITGANLLKLAGALWNLRPQTMLKVSYEKNGQKVNLEYQTQAQLQQQIAALKELDSALMIQVIQAK